MQQNNNNISTEQDDSTRTYTTEELLKLLETSETPDDDPFKPRPESEEGDYACLGNTTWRHTCGNNLCIDPSIRGRHWIYMHMYDFSSFRLVLGNTNEQDIRTQFPSLIEYLNKHGLPYVVYLLVVHPRLLDIDLEVIHKWINHGRKGLLYDIGEGGEDSDHEESDAEFDDDNNEQSQSDE
ncbi:hypothetical protein BDC45DRAFT_531552 [Circinella umbellata]|nr:hypothetical protein BDC45DRAFT_531552 [Circinella umbellata]